MCHLVEEMSPHLFLHCPISRPISHSVWFHFLIRFNRCWLMLESILGLLHIWDKEEISDLTLAGQFLWRCISRVICWSLWLEWNAHSFNRKASPNDKILANTLSLMFGWTSHRPHFSGKKFHDFVFDWDIIVFKPQGSLSPLGRDVPLVLFSVSIKLILFIKKRKKEGSGFGGNQKVG